MENRDRERRKKRSRDGEEQAAPEMRASYIDINTLKQRYGGTALSPEELAEMEQEHRRVRDSEKELSVFGEGQEDEPQEGYSRHYTIFAIAFFAALFVGILVAVYMLLIIDRIEVSGNERLEKGEVLTIAGINIGEHILFADIDGAKEALEADAAIREATVKRVFPDALSITIEERVPVAYVEGTGSGAIVDIEGYVMEITTVAPHDLIVIYGYSSAGFQVGQRLAQYSEFSSTTLLDILTALSEQGVMESIANIDMSQPLNIGMTTYDGYTIVIGQPEGAAQKLQNLALVLNKVRSMGYVGGTIDVGVLGGPVYAPPVREEEVPPQEGPDGEESAEGGNEEGAEEEAQAESGEEAREEGGEE